MDNFFYTAKDAFSLNGIQRVHFSEERKRITLFYFNGEIFEFDGGANVFEEIKARLITKDKQTPEQFRIDICRGNGEVSSFYYTDQDLKKLNKFKDNER